ncbi:MAG TPA: sigma-70 family RNA polymerase sigma factor [Cytophagaceae bacterium]
MKTKDKKIINAIRSGEDHKALETLYKCMLPHIIRMVNTGSDREETAKDILQEAMLIFYKQVICNKFDESYPNGIGGFIYSVAKNLWINQIKRSKKFIQIDSEDILDLRETNILDEIEFNERRELVEKIFSQLGSKCQELLKLTIYEEMTMKEVAEKTGYPNANAATVAAHRCKKNLTQIIKKYKSLYTLVE